MWFGVSGAYFVLYGKGLQSSYRHITKTPQAQTPRVCLDVNPYREPNILNYLYPEPKLK